MALFSNLPPPMTGTAESDEKDGKEKIGSSSGQMDGHGVEKKRSKTVVSKSATTTSTSTPVGKGKPSTDVNSVLSMKTTTSFMPSSLRSRKPVSKVKRKVRRSRFSRMVLPKTEGNTITQSTTAMDKNMFTTPCDDDYNPAEPNNYADYCEQRRSREDMKRREEEHRYVLQQQQQQNGVIQIGRGRGRGMTVPQIGRGRGRGMTVPAWMKHG